MLSKQDSRSRFKGINLRAVIFGVLMLGALFLAACQSQSQTTSQAQNQGDAEAAEVVFEVAETLMLPPVI